VKPRFMDMLPVLMLICLMLLGLAHCSPGDAPSAGRNGVRNFGKGSFRTVGEIPLLFVSGTPYDQGYQYGVLLRDEIVENVAYFKNVLREMHPSDWDAFFNAVCRREAWLPADWMEKIHGIADGCGELDFRDILLINAMFGVSYCTSAAVKVNGEYVHLKNPEMGWQAEELPFLLIVEENTSGSRMIYTTNYGPGTFLADNGMNDRGISLTVNALPRFPGEPDIAEEDKMSPYVFRYRVLSECSSLQQVESLVRSFHFPRPNGYVVVSALENRAAKFEIAPPEFAMETSDGGNLFLTNHYNIGKMRKYQTPTSGGYKVDSETSFCWAEPCVPATTCWSANMPTGSSPTRRMPCGCCATIGTFMTWGKNISDTCGWTRLRPTARWGPTNRMPG
jgi:hypothetical protein